MSSPGGLPVYAIAVLIFIFNVCGYACVRYFIADDIFGGDTVNVAISIMDSYTLKDTNVIDWPAFYKQLLSGKGGNPELDKNAFVYNQLSGKGREALERLSEKPDDVRAHELLLLELNKSLFDRDIIWPAALLKDALRKPLLAKAGKPNYNLVVLCSLYPGIVRDTFPPRFQWKYDLASILEELPKVTMAYFTINVPTRYSPLVNIYVTEVQMYMQNSPEHLLPVIVFNGLFYAAMITVVFLIAVKFIRSVWWSLCAVLLFQASVSAILISYELFSLPYIFVPLMMAAAVLAYLQYKEKGNVWWLLAFVLLSIIGPWFREFPGATPFIVFVSELMSYQGKRSRVILIACIPLMVHSFYPALLPWLVGLNKGGVYNVLAQGNVMQATGAGSQPLNWYFSGLLFAQFPPTVWILVLTAIVYWAGRVTQVSAKESEDGGLAGRVLSGIARTPKYGHIIMLVVAACGFGYLIVKRGMIGHLIANYGVWMLLFVLLTTVVVFIVALASFRFSALLPVFFGATFLPFLRLQLAELHLAFVLIPLSILLTLWIKDLFHHLTLNLKAGERPLSVVLVSVLLVIGLTDQFLNLPSCIAAQKRIVGANKAAAAWFVNNAPRHSIVVANYYNFTDVYYYSHYYIDPYESVGNCPMGPAKVVHENEEFKGLLDRNFGIRDVYLLASDHEFRYSGFAAYHSHKWVKEPPGEIEKLAVFPARTYYYYVDPLKYFVPKYFISFIGYMDWSTDFFYDNTKTPFKRIVYTDYVIYKLKDISKGFPTDKSTAAKKEIAVNHGDKQR